MRKRNGFTLIELLVVIAIIAILAAILFPAFLAAKRQSQKAHCVSGIKQLSGAFSIYADDNGNCAPCNYTWSEKRYPNGEANHENCWLWMHYLYPYVKDIKVYNCPAMRAKWTGGYYWADTPDHYSEASYGYNRWLGRYTWEQRVSFSQISKTMQTPVLADCSYYLTGPKQNADGYNNDIPPTQRHDGMSVMSFVDGHVQAIKPENWVTNNDRINPDPIWRKWDPLL